MQHITLQVAIALAWVIAGIAASGWWHVRNQVTPLRHTLRRNAIRVSELELENKRLRKLLADEQIDWRDDRKLTQIWRPGSDLLNR